MFQLDDCMALTTAKSSKMLVAALEKRLKPYHMSRIQWFALYYIHSNHGLTQKALAELIMVREPTVARVLRELEQMELVERRCERSDKRQRHLYLTERGESRFMEILPEVERFKTETVAHISAEHLMILKDCLAKMVENASTDCN